MNCLLSILSSFDYLGHWQIYAVSSGSTLCLALILLGWYLFCKSGVESPP